MHTAAPLPEVETEADEVAEYLSHNKKAGRSNGISKLKEQIEDAEAKVNAMEIQLEDAKEQEMMMPGVRIPSLSPTVSLVWLPPGNPIFETMSIR